MALACASVVRFPLIRFPYSPPRVAIILEELSLAYEFVPIQLSEVKTPQYLAINPNGRIPAIYDPNTNLTLWESGAIVEYLVQRYDTIRKISFPLDSNEAALAKQWLFFQASGQGPYYGQACWFKKFHSERIDSALDRYIKEINRVSKVVDDYLLDKEWLVGNKCSYADLAWVSWQATLGKIITSEDGYDTANYPNLQAWINRMLGRPGVRKVIADAIGR